MVEPNSRILLDIIKDDNSKITTKFHYENLKTSFHGFYTRNWDILFVILFLIVVILLHIYRGSIKNAWNYMRTKKYRVKNDLPNLLACKRCRSCDSYPTPTRTSSPDRRALSNERLIREMLHSLQDRALRELDDK